MSPSGDIFSWVPGMSTRDFGPLVSYSFYSIYLCWTVLTIIIITIRQRVGSRRDDARACDNPTLRIREPDAVGDEQSHELDCGDTRRDVQAAGQDERTLPQLRERDRINGHGGVLSRGIEHRPPREHSLPPRAPAERAHARAQRRARTQGAQRDRKGRQHQLPAVQLLGNRRRSWARDEFH